MLYFGYGSNLNRADLEAWCASRGHDAGGIVPVARAWLPDSEVVFHYLSRTRKGGALSVRSRRGSVVPGVLFEVDAAGWRALDAKEGAPRTYARTDCVVLADDGSEVRARTYVVTPSFVRDGHVPPSDAYVRLVCEGLGAHGLPDAHVCSAARSLDTRSLVRSLFVYGTLMRGEERHSMIASRDPVRARDASASGRLLHLGAYPGLVPCSRGGRVRGELVELHDPHDALHELDEVEEFLGYGRAGSLYRRVLIEARSDDGERSLAWTYRYLGAADGAREIASGDWRAR